MWRLDVQLSALAMTWQLPKAISAGETVALIAGLDVDGSLDCGHGGDGGGQ
jgi:hypothetical protein